MNKLSFILALILTIFGTSAFANGRNGYGVPGYAGQYHGPWGQGPVYYPPQRVVPVQRIIGSVTIQGGVRYAPVQPGYPYPVYPPQPIYTAPPPPPAYVVMTPPPVYAPPPVAMQPSQTVYATAVPGPTPVYPPSYPVQMPVPAPAPVAVNQPPAIQPPVMVAALPSKPEIIEPTQVRELPPVETKVEHRFEPLPEVVKQVPEVIEAPKSDQHIVDMQNHLKEMGLYDGEITGQMNDETASALAEAMKPKVEVQVKTETKYVPVPVSHPEMHPQSTPIPQHIEEPKVVEPVTPKPEQKIEEPAPVEPPHTEVAPEQKVHDAEAAAAGLHVAPHEQVAEVKKKAGEDFSMTVVAPLPAVPQEPVATSSLTGVTTAIKTKINGPL